MTNKENTGLDDSGLFTRQEAARFLRVKESTLAVWQTTGRYNLPVVKVGRLVRYRHADLLLFLERRTRGAAREISQ